MDNPGSVIFHDFLYKSVPPLLRHGLLASSRKGIGQRGLLISRESLKSQPRRRTGNCGSLWELFGLCFITFVICINHFHFWFPQEKSFNFSVFHRFCCLVWNNRHLSREIVTISRLQNTVIVHDGIYISVADYNSSRVDVGCHRSIFTMGYWDNFSTLWATGLNFCFCEEASYKNLLYK